MDYLTLYYLGPIFLECYLLDFISNDFFPRLSFIDSSKSTFLPLGCLINREKKVKRDEVGDKAGTPTDRKKNSQKRGEKGYGRNRKSWT